ncbi:MAG: hypothetical protein IPN84_01355 [Sphingomonadales bacterium]|nr:hypothetical protein [Sphingomonadales bacterium]
MTEAGSDFVQSMQAKRLSAHFTAADLCCAGETWQRVRIWNEPQQKETWAALEQLCETILEPVVARFGMPRLTYGFASSELFRHISSGTKAALGGTKEAVGGTTAALDQHAACELRRSGKLICPRMGAAVDFAVPSVSSLEIAHWVAFSLPFDRMYVYGPDRPFHVSVGPENTKGLVQMIEWAPGRLRPQNRKLAWLDEVRDAKSLA